MQHKNLLCFVTCFGITLSACGRDGGHAQSGNTLTQTDVAASTANGASTAAGSAAGTSGTSGTVGDSNTAATNGNTATPVPTATPAPTPTAAALDPDTCNVVADNELMITRVSVVEDSVRTTWTGGAAAQDGAWAIGRVLTRLSGAQDAGPYVNSLLSSLTADDSFMASNWPQSGGAFTLTGTPMILDAIVNRVDLRNPATGSMGELRFVFGTNVAGTNTDGKIIVEITVPSSSTFSQLTWAQAWHRLSDTSLTPAQFNTALQVLTDYALDNAQTHYRVRTANETPLQDWTFRQFEPQGGVLVPANLTLTPAANFDKASLDDPNSFYGQQSRLPASAIIAPNDRATLLSFVASLSGQITDGNYSIPANMSAPSFQMQRSYRSEANGVGSDESWSIPSVSALESATFSVNTCNGCHGLPLFLGPTPAQVGHRVAGLPSPLSNFLTGTNDGKYSDLQRRATDMSSILCGNGASVAGASVVVPLN